MMNNNSIIKEQIIKKIFMIRGKRVMIDQDLAELYNLPTKSLNLAVKRNIDRFPDDFMFQLSKEEYENLKFQFETSRGVEDDTIHMFLQNKELQCYQVY